MAIHNSAWPAILVMLIGLIIIKPEWQILYMAWGILSLWLHDVWVENYLEMNDKAPVIPLVIMAEAISFFVVFTLEPMVCWTKPLFIPLVNTVILVLSSMCVQAALLSHKAGDRVITISSLSGAISLGLAFLTIQLQEFFYSVDLTYAFYAATCLHGIHVLIGLGLLSTLFILL